MRTNLDVFNRWLVRVDERVGSGRHAALLLFALAFAVKFAWVVVSRDDLVVRVPIMDAKYYDDWARNIAAGSWTRPGAFFMGPLYPTILGVVYRLFGADYNVVRVLQALGGASTVAITFLLGRRVLRPAVALAGAIILIFYGALTFYEGRLLMVWLGTLLNVLALYLLVSGAQQSSPRRFALAGVVLGASALARASILLFVPFVVGWAWRKLPPVTRTRCVGLFLLCACAVVSTATIHNAVTSHDFVLVTSNGGLNFYIGNSRSATGVFYPPRGVDFVGDTTSRIYIERKLGRDLKPSEISRYWFRRAVADISENPSRAVRLTLKKIAMFFNGAEIAQLESFDLTRNRYLLLRFLFVGFWFLLVAGLPGMLLAPRNRYVALLAGFVAVYAVSIIVFFVTSRYRVQIAPVLSLFAAQSILVGFPALLSRKINPVRAVALCAVLAAMTSPTFFKQSGAENLFRDHVHRGRRLAQIREFSAALDELDAAVDMFPGFAEGYIHRAIVNKEAGRRFQAIEDYVRALRLQPQMASVHYDLAQIMRQANMTGEAVKEYREALRIDPLMIKAENNLGIALREMKDYAGAIASFRRVIELDPAYVRGYNNLGSCLAVVDSMEAAAGVFEETTRRFPEYANGYKNLAMAWASLGNPWKAIVAIEGYLKLKPGDTEAHNMLRKLRIAADAAAESGHPR